MNSSEPRKTGRPSLIRRFQLLRSRLNAVPLFTNRYASLILLGSVLFFFGVIFLLLWQYAYLPPQVPLFYTQTFALRLADKQTLLFFPLILFGLVFTDAALAISIYKREPIIAFLLLCVLLFTVFFSFIGLIKIFSLVL